MEYAFAKYRRNRKENGELVDEILEDLRKKAYNDLKVTKELIVISSSDEEIVVMGVSASCGSSALDVSLSLSLSRSSLSSTSTRYRKIFMTGCVFFLRAPNAPIEQVAKKPIKSKVKLTNYIIGLRAPKAPDVGSSRRKRKSN
nr:hypothetical protein [Tanacetum cinerariifolium]